MASKVCVISRTSLCTCSAYVATNRLVVCLSVCLSAQALFCERTALLKCMCAGAIGCTIMCVSQHCVCAVACCQLCWAHKTSPAHHNFFAARPLGETDRRVWCELRAYKQQAHLAWPVQVSASSSGNALAVVVWRSKERFSSWAANQWLV